MTVSCSDVPNGYYFTARRATSTQPCVNLRYSSHMPSRHRRIIPNASTKKSALKKSKRSTGSGAACWPGFKRVPGTKAGAKGSCEPKEHQTASQKKADSKAAAARKREKTGHD